MATVIDGYNPRTPAGIHLLKVNNRNIVTRGEISSDLTIKTGGRFWCLYCKLCTYFTPCSSVFIVNLEHVIAG